MIHILPEINLGNKLIRLLDSGFFLDARLIYAQYKIKAPPIPPVPLLLR